MWVLDEVDYHAAHNLVLPPDVPNGMEELGLAANMTSLEEFAPGHLRFYRPPVYMNVIDVDRPKEQKN